MAREAGALLAHGERELRTIDPPVDSTAMMFERWASDPNVSVEKIERLMTLWERSEARKAEAAFNGAMSAAQREMRPVAADASNPQTRSRYASYAQLDRALRPVYTDHGFGISYDTGTADQPDHVRVLGYVTHGGGHARTYHIDMPSDGKGAKGGDVMTKTHATGAAMSYGMRYLLKMVFNIAVGEDDADGNAPAPRRQPEAAPAGAEAWWDDMTAAADNGLPALEAAWKASRAEFKTWASKAKRTEINALKAKASRVAAS